MQFSSSLFLFIYLPLTFAAFSIAKSIKQRKILLIFAGYLFYGFFDWRYCGLLLLSTVIGFASGAFIAGISKAKNRHVAMTAGIGLQLCVLGLFKYYNFVGSTINALTDEKLLPYLSIALPIGISFYTFSTISYIVDVGRGRIKPGTNILDFLAFVSFFPKLVSGPLVRFQDFSDNFDDLDKPLESDNIVRAAYFFSIGLAKKVIVADTFARALSPMLAEVASLSTVGAWAAALGYTFQLYYDFSGYSDMAVGLGLLFRVNLPQNFNAPYRAMGARDFWRRWHISLSVWLRDYLFLPMAYAASRRVRDFRWRGFTQDHLVYILATLGTMTIAGIWHGANWTFIVWGAYHGILLCIDQLLSRKLKRIPKPVYRLFTFLSIIVGWVIFRSTDFSMAVAWLHRMFWPHMLGQRGSFMLIALIGICLMAVNVLPETWDVRPKLSPSFAVVLAAVLFASIIFMNGSNAPFLYYQF